MRQSASRARGARSSGGGTAVAGSEQPSGRRWRERQGALLVVALALAASSSGLRNDYAMDDLHLLAEDARVHSLADLGQVFTSSYWPEPFPRDLYRPLSTFSFVAQWALGGGSPLVFRVSSYLLYAAVSLAALALARLLLPTGVALAVALLFAAHPVHVEAVALGVNQSEQWVALLALIATARYLAARRRGWPSGREWALITLLYLAACLFKEHAVAIPGLLLAAELTLLGDAGDAGARARARRLGPGFAVLAAVGGAFLALRTAVLGSFAGSFTADALVGQSIGGRTLTMLQVVPEWLRLLLWPAHLQGDYSPAVIEQATRWGWAQTAGLVLLIALAALAWRLRKEAPAVPFGLLWCGAALLPVSNVLLPTGIVLAERTLYLPSVGFLLAVGGVAAAVLGGAATLWGRRRLGGRVVAATVAVLVALGTVRSAVRHRDWRDHFHFWARTVEDAPLSHRAHYAHGQALYRRGEEEAALRAFYRAIALHSRSYWIQHELADLFRLRGACPAALHWYAESLRIEPHQPAARLSRIACLVQMGRLEEAMAEADLAVSVQESRER